MTKMINLNSEIQEAPDPKDAFALDVLMGLSTTPKSLSPKYFYDAIGSELFKKITDTDDYYPTKCEAEIFETHKKEIASISGDGPINVIELGAGDGRKTRIIIEEFLKVTDEISYCPIDISESANTELVEKFSKEFPSLKITGVVGEYFSALNWLRTNKKGRNIVLFLGSNIGNFSMPQIEVFLRTMWNCLNKDDLALIGFDFKKDIDVLLRAYNDSDGVTKKFNLNLLSRLNKELGANFDVDKFTHFGTYNVKLGAMESFILSLEDQDVYVEELNKSFHFQPYEPIHVEYSFKFLKSDILTLAKDTGFEIENFFTDSKNYFTDALYRVNKKKGTHTF